MLLPHAGWPVAAGPALRQGSLEPGVTQGCGSQSHHTPSTWDTGSVKMCSHLESKHKARIRATVPYTGHGACTSYSVRLYAHSSVLLLLQGGKEAECSWPRDAACNLRRRGQPTWQWPVCEVCCAVVRLLRAQQTEADCASRNGLTRRACLRHESTWIHVPYLRAPPAELCSLHTVSGKYRTANHQLSHAPSRQRFKLKRIVLMACVSRRLKTSSISSVMLVLLVACTSILSLETAHER